MPRANGLVFSIDPARAQGLEAHLGARDARALNPGGCSLELLCDSFRRPREVTAIVSWELAVPLKVERLALALIAGGAELRRDLDPDTLRLHARTSGHHVLRVVTLADLEPFRPGPARFAAGAAPIGLRSFSSAA